MVDSGTSSVDDDSTATDRLFAEFLGLRKEFLAAGGRKPMRLVPSQEQSDLPDRGLGLPEIESGVRTLMDLYEQVKGLITFGAVVGGWTLWLIQVAYNQNHKQKLLVAQVIGLLRGYGLREVETSHLMKIAEQDLIRLGLPGTKAGSGAKEVVEAVVRNLSPEVDDDDPGVAQQVLEHLRNLSAYAQSWEFKEQSYGGRVKVMLPGNNERRVQIHFGKKNAAGRPLVELVSVCDKVDKSNLEQVLRMNNFLEFGKYAIDQGIDPQGNESSYVLIRHLVPLEEVTEAFLAKALPYLASKADALEAQLLPSRKHQ